MTDIPDEVDSNSSKVTVTKDHVKRLKNIWQKLVFQTQKQ